MYSFSSIWSLITYVLYIPFIFLHHLFELILIGFCILNFDLSLNPIYIIKNYISMRKNLFYSYVKYSFYWLIYFLILVKRFSSDKARELVQWENMIADAFMNRLELEEKKNIENRVINTQESYVQYCKLFKVCCFIVPRSVKYVCESYII